MVMTRQGHRISMPKEQVTQGLALCVLLLIGGLAIAGPSGLLAWSENSTLLKEREARIAVLTEDRDRLKNRIELLNPENADPDLTGELLRENLNVVHPDEIVLKLDSASD